MLYLLDASALISAHNTWFAMGRVPEFWTWLTHHGATGAIKMPAETYDEVENGNDELSLWMTETSTKTALLLQEPHNDASVEAVLSCYGTALTEDDLAKIGQDPFLIAAAVGITDRCVVSSEVSRPKSKGSNRKVPDICSDCGVPCISPVQLIRVLDFKTSWNN